MGFLQRARGRLLPSVDRRIDWRVDRKLEERVLPELPRQGEALAGLAADLATLSEKLMYSLGEMRRWMIDDLEAANETTMLLGESLAGLQTSVEKLGSELAAMNRRLADIEAGTTRSPSRPA